MLEYKGHKLKRIYEGKGITGKITPSCSCGWIGIGYEAHNDYQHSNVREQESKHITDIRLGRINDHH